MVALAARLNLQPDSPLNSFPDKDAEVAATKQLQLHLALSIIEKDMDNYAQFRFPDEQSEDSRREAEREYIGSSSFSSMLRSLDFSDEAYETPLLNMCDLLQIDTKDQEDTDYVAAVVASLSGMLY